eukprot:1521088-Prymnesium_polylepis.1
MLEPPLRSRKTSPAVPDVSGPSSDTTDAPLVRSSPRARGEPSARERGEPCPLPGRVRSCTPASDPSSADGAGVLSRCACSQSCSVSLIASTSAVREPASPWRPKCGEPQTFAGSRSRQ